jgi:radical SAM superfamily enzyme
MADKRRICWPNPDATCLEGGCIHCNDARLRSINVIREYAAKAGILPNRAKGVRDAWSAFKYGERINWPNIDKN